MKFNIHGKKIDVTESIKSYIEEKIGRLDKYFENPDEITATALIKLRGKDQVVEVTINANKFILRGEESHKDLYASIDKDIDILEGQIRKAKAKKEKMMKDSSIKQMNFAGVPEVKVENEVVKSISYELKPISVEDAKIKLDERKGNIFYTFVNVDTGKVNVIFKLKDSNNYGLVEPEA